MQSHPAPYKPQRRVLSMDGMVPAQPARRQPLPTVRQQQRSPAPTLRPAPKPRRQRWVLPRQMTGTLQWLLVIVIATLIGSFVQSVTIGEMAIGLYAVAVVVLKITSQQTFLLALLSLLTVVVLLITNPDSQLSDNFAVYSFLLLVLGTVSLAFETRKSS